MNFINSHYTKVVLYVLAFPVFNVQFNRRLEKCSESVNSHSVFIHVHYELN
jgi:hypothetical protein